MGKIKQFESLSTSYVNLAALIRYLRERQFTGAIHVALDKYEADVFLHGRNPATASEIDPSSRVASLKDGAMERLLVHAREPNGTITVFEGKPTEIAEPTDAPLSELQVRAEGKEAAPAEEVDWDDLLQTSGEVIAAVERAIQSVGADFTDSFRFVRIELGDDYPFLDPTTAELKYRSGKVSLDERPGVNVYVGGLSECLRRVVNKMAMGKEGKRFRERVAVELAVASRMRSMGKFTPELDRIAGTRVL
jgi:hypothetical protein